MDFRMDSSSFDAPTRAPTAGSSRREVLHTVAAAPGVGAAFATGLVSAGQGKGGKKKRKQKPVFNAFGCVDVDGECVGKDANSCSGLCQGKKPKKGEKNKSRCVAHNTGGCTVAEQSCGGSPAVPCGAGGACFVTTGNASFCGGIGSACAACRRDADCQVGYGPGAACVICANGSCPTTGDRACVPAAA
jgi:hypothetical protein